MSGSALAKGWRTAPAERHLGFLVDGKMNMGQQSAPTAKRANCILECIRDSIANWSSEVIVLLSSALVWFHLKYCVQFWVLQYQNGVKEK